eukprot:419044-Amphidinium_carterae.1
MDGRKEGTAAITQIDVDDDEELADAQIPDTVCGHPPGLMRAKPEEDLIGGSTHTFQRSGKQRGEEEVSPSRAVRR